MRDEKKLQELYIEIYKELGTYEQMSYPDMSALSMAQVDLLYTEGYGEPQIKRNFEVCFPAKESIQRSQIIEIKNMRFYTRCEHHGLPFFGFAHYAYIPDELLCGLSKPARVIQHFSHKYQLEEELTQQIADYLWDMVKPVAQVLVLEGVHLCSIMRGIRTPDELVRVREEQVNEKLYHEQEREGHLYHLVKDLLAMSLKSDMAPVRLM